MLPDILRISGIFSKRILTYLYCTKFNEIKLCHSDVQKHVSYTGLKNNVWYIMDYAWIRLEIHFQMDFIVCFFIILSFNALLDVHRVLKHYTVLRKINKLFFFLWGIIVEKYNLTELKSTYGFILSTS